AGATEDDLTDPKYGKQPQWPRDCRNHRISSSVHGYRLRHGLDDLAGGVGNENGARRVDALEQHHRQVPPAILADEVGDETQRSDRKRRGTWRALEGGARIIQCDYGSLYRASGNTPAEKSPCTR